MEDIHIEGVHEAFFTPTVNFEAATGHCEIAGESYLEETSKFYARLLDWIRKYVATVKGPLNFDFKLSYFNTSSSKCLVDILDLLKKYQNDGGSVSVNWYYDDSEEELEEVEDFILETGLDINKIPMEV
ncbi:MAG: DUF1987 domain-containing protein [Bacteroidales bacterium]|jgi:hypothetical protein|nr:DUF1987 domain-containing protein [Bacteroidales bacterium]MBR2104884.1 DUF1987 domain-containing protein [Bacteroidales bacterium]